MKNGRSSSLLFLGVKIGEEENREQIPKSFRTNSLTMEVLVTANSKQIVLPFDSTRISNCR